jgi:hypothetical protein
VKAAEAPWCQHLQALEDAIKWRRARTAAPCPDCQATPDGKCDDHGRDADLIADYERTARQLVQTAPNPHISNAP